MKTGYKCNNARELSPLSHEHSDAMRLRAGSHAAMPLKYGTANVLRRSMPEGQPYTDHLALPGAATDSAEHVISAAFRSHMHLRSLSGTNEMIVCIHNWCVELYVSRIRCYSA